MTINAPDLKAWSPDDNIVTTQIQPQIIKHWTVTHDRLTSANVHLPTIPRGTLSPQNYLNDTRTIPHSNISTLTSQHGHPLTTGDWAGFIQAVTWIANAHTPTPSKGPFLYEFSQSAATHNSKILESFDYDLARVIAAHPNSISSPGSELRPIHHLKILIGNHPNFPHISRILTHGIDYPAEDLPEKTRIKELTNQLERGNHKSALTAEAKPIVDKLVKQDVTFGYALTITKDCIIKLKHGELYPLGLQHQITIDEKGTKIPKKRVTHDLSNRKRHGLSINQRVDEDKLPPTMYGFALQRFLILIHHIRFHHPDKRILLCKSDFDKAYRRLHTTPRIAAKCISAWTTSNDPSDQHNEEFIGTIMTRLPFGSTPAPAEFSIVSETIFDLASDLLLCPFWDPDKLPSPYDKYLPPPKRIDDSTPFGKALEPDVHLPKHQICGVEGYIDDGAIAVLDIPRTKNMVKRARQALPMASHLCFRPLANNEPIPRPDPQSLRKMEAEGRLQETPLIFLGWSIETRPFEISLPQEKVTSWTSSINSALKQLSITFDEAQTLIGRLNHVGFIIPSARHFLNRIRRLEFIADRHGTAKISDETHKDLLLWTEFLERARKGISINLVVFRRPTLFTISDASEYGIGGYCLQTGQSWRYEFTKLEREVFSLNLKEFIGSVVNGKVFLPLDDSPFPCLLSIGDSTSAAGWLQKSNFDPDCHPIHAEVAREHARVIMAHNACDYSQHIPGITNVVADSLSRDFHLSNKQLISMLYAVNPPFLPKQMNIVPLPNEITSWIGSLALKQHKRKVLPERHTKSTIARGVCGWTSNADATQITPIWTDSNLPTKYSSSELSCTLSELELLTHKADKSRQTLRKRPSITWQRKLLQVVGQTQPKIQPEKQT